MLITSAWTWLSRPSDTTASFAERSTMQLLLSERSPELILLGNSVVEKDVDLGALAQGLGIRGSKVVRLVVPLSRMPVWYAVLSHVVAPRVQKPEVLIVLGTWEGMVQAPGAGEAEQLWEWMRLSRTAPKTGLVTGDSGWERARGRSALARKSGLDAVKEVSVGLVFSGAASGGVRASGRAVAEPALEALFGKEEGRDLDQRRRVIPVVEAVARDQGSGGQGGSLEADMIRNFLSVASDAGIRVVFVRVPVSPEKKVNKNKDRAVEYWLRGLLYENKAGWIDLQQLEVGAEHFTGVVHLDDYGQKVFTEALVSQLKKMGVGSEAEWNLTPPPPGLRRRP